MFLLRNKSVSITFAPLFLFCFGNLGSIAEKKVDNKVQNIGKVVTNMLASNLKLT